MIIGQVTPDREAVISLELFSAADESVDLVAVLDTGFTAYLTLSPTQIAQLGLVQVHTAIVVLGDGSETSVPVYRGEIQWHDQRRLIYVHETDGGALLGMSLLYGSLLKMRVVDGGAVTIEPLE